MSTEQRRGDPDGARRAQLLDRLLEYSAAHGLSDTSLRPLAAAVGSSPRVLLYFFGSKQQLVRAVHQHARRHQQALLADVVDGHADATTAIRALWTWLADDAHHNVERFFFEGYARSLHDSGGPWRGFGADSVHEWLPHIRTAVGDAADPTLVLATLRGLLLDLLATGDVDRVSGALEAWLDTMNPPATRGDARAARP